MSDAGLAKTAIENAEYEDQGPWAECPNCGGTGLTAGCFEDCCSGADCDPDDPENCCAPNRCDWCRGKGGHHIETEDTDLPSQEREPMAGEGQQEDRE